MAEDRVQALVPMAYVASVPRSAAFYEILGFTLENSFTRPVPKRRAGRGSAPAAPS